MPLPINRATELIHERGEKAKDITQSIELAVLCCGTGEGSVCYELDEFGRYWVRLSDEYPLTATMPIPKALKKLDELGFEYGGAKWRRK
jgi:hypothetical protein